MRKYYQIYVLILCLFLAACSPRAADQPTVEVTSTTEGTSNSIPATAIEMAPTAEIEPTATAMEVAQKPTAVCSTPAELTPEMTEGPYYKAGSPERASLLEEGTPGTVLILSGYVLDEACNPIANAWLDFWQANANGEYDNAGYTLRGHLYTDENGYFQLETVVPGEYPGRTEHIHVKVQAPGGSVLTSQLYFPGVQANAGDGIYDARNLINVESSSTEQVSASFNFIIRTS